MPRSVHTDVMFAIKLTNVNMSSQATRRLCTLQITDMNVISVGFQHYTKPTWRYITKDTLTNSDFGVKSARRGSTQIQSYRDIRISTQTRSLISVTYVVKHSSTSQTCGSIRKATTQGRTQNITNAMCVVKTSHLRAH
jgi:hypothetical protein